MRVDSETSQIEDLIEHAAWVRGLARSLVGDAHAEDVVQDTWLTALRRPPTEGRNLRAWLRRVVSNLARQRYGRVSRQAAKERAAQGRIAPVATPEELAHQVETQRQVARLVLKLDEPYRQTVLLRYYQGLPSPEIARRMSAPEGTVRRRLSHALGILRERLDAEFGDRSAWSIFLAPLVGRDASLVGPVTTGLSALLKGILAMHTGLKVTTATLALLLVFALTPLGRMAVNLFTDNELGEPTGADQAEVAQHDEEQPTTPTSAASSPSNAAPTRLPIEAVITVPPAEHTVAMPPVATQSVLVVDSRGRPIPDARLYLCREGQKPPSVPYSDPPEPQGRTNSAGRFAQEDPQPGRYIIMAVHPDFAHSEWTAFSVTRGEAGTDVTLVLNQGGRIEGSVDSALGEIEGRRVDLYSFRGDIGWRDTTTDEFGRFVIEKVMPQDYIVQLIPERSASGAEVHGVRKQITVRTEETTHVRFEVVRTITVLGCVKSGGNPLVGVYITAEPLGGNPDQSDWTETGPSGQFELEVGGPGEYAFKVQAEGRGSYASVVRSVPDAETVEVSFEVPCGAIAGRVILPDGRLGGRLPITVMPVLSPDASALATLAAVRSCHTDDDGGFRFRFLETGSYTVRTPDYLHEPRRVPRTRYGRVVLSELTVSDSRSIEDLEIRLLPEGMISGEVVDGIGNAISGAWVQVQDAHHRNLSCRWECSTDSDGHFEVGSIAPGKYRVHVLYKGTPEQRRGMSPFFDVEEGETTSVQIELP